MSFVHVHHRKVTSYGLWLDMLVIGKMVRVTYMFMMVLVTFMYSWILQGIMVLLFVKFRCSHICLGCLSILMYLILKSFSY